MGQKVNPVGLRLGNKQRLGLCLVCKKKRFWQLSN